MSFNPNSPPALVSGARDSSKETEKGVLEGPDVADDPLIKAAWVGEVEIDGCRWWGAGERGSGAFVFSGRRQPYRVGSAA